MVECNPEPETSVYNFTVETLDFKNRSIGEYQNNILLIVNVATYWAFTPQYRDFNPLLERYTKNNFRILAFPCNQFDLQEPGENWEILNGLRYVRPGGDYQPHPNLTIFGKLEVNGQNAHAMYKYLKKSCPPTTTELGNRTLMQWNPIDIRDLTWNFEKFLIDRRGIPRYRFRPGNWRNGTVIQPFLETLLSETSELQATIYRLPPTNQPLFPEPTLAENTSPVSDNNNTFGNGFVNFWRTFNTR